MNVPTQDAMTSSPSLRIHSSCPCPAVTQDLSLPVCVYVFVCLCCAAVDTADQKSNCQSVCSPAAIEARWKGASRIHWSRACTPALNDLLNLFDFGIEAIHPNTHRERDCYSSLPSIIRDPLR